MEKNKETTTLDYSNDQAMNELNFAYEMNESIMGT